MLSSSFIIMFPTVSMRVSSAFITLSYLGPRLERTILAFFLPRANALSMSSWLEGTYGRLNMLCYFVCLDKIYL